MVPPGSMLPAGCDRPRQERGIGRGASPAAAVKDTGTILPESCGHRTVYTMAGVPTRRSTTKSPPVPMALAVMVYLLVGVLIQTQTLWLSFAPTNEAVGDDATGPSFKTTALAAISTLIVTKPVEVGPELPYTGPMTTTEAKARAKPETDTAR